MIHLRSPLLKKMPRAEYQGRITRIRNRSFWTSLSLIICTIIIVATYTQVLGDWGFILYYLHDYVFLKIKGWLHTYNWPMSILWYRLLPLVFFGWLFFFYLRDRSMIRVFHRKALDWTIRQAARGNQMLNNTALFLAWIPNPAQYFVQDPLARLLINVSGLLKKRNVTPEMIAKAVSRECQLRFSQLSTYKHGHGPASLCSEINHLSNILLELECLPTSSQTEQLQAVTDWYECRILIQAHVADDLYIDDEGAALRFIHKVMSPKPERKNEVFSLQSLYFGMRDSLACGWNRSSTSLRALADACVRRREFLDSLAEALELKFENRSTDLIKIPDQKVSVVEAPLMGRLAIALNLQLAFLSGQFEQARDFIEAIERFSLVAEIFPDQHNQWPLRLFRDQPQTWHYSYMAHLAAGKTSQRKKTWENLDKMVDNPILPEHIFGDEQWLQDMTRAGVLELPGQEVKPT